VQLATLDLPEPHVVASGERLEFSIRGAVDAGDGPPDEGIGVRVRSAQDGQVLFATGTAIHRIEVPSAGPFDLAIRLQMNVRPGIYALESYVWDIRGQREIAAGPAAHIQVVEGTPFVGTVQMCPQLNFVRGTVLDIRSQVRAAC
jgi:hypothetical protein